MNKRDDINLFYEDLTEVFAEREVSNVLDFFSPEVIDDETGEIFPDRKFAERKKVKKISRENLLEICARIFFAYGMAHALRKDND